MHKVVRTEIPQRFKINIRFSPIPTVFAKNTISYNESLTFRHSQRDWQKASAASSAQLRDANLAPERFGAFLVSSFGWWRHANLIVGISLLERTEMLEDVKRHLEGRPCDLHMRSPAAQLLIA